MSILFLGLFHLVLSMATIVGAFSVFAALIPKEWNNGFMNGIGHLIHFVAFNFWHAENK